MINNVLPSYKAVLPQLTPEGRSYPTGRFLRMTKLPLLPIRKLPEVSSNGQVSRCFMPLGGIWKAFQVVF